MLDATSATSERSQTIATCVGWGLALVLASLPFELYAGISLASLTFTNVEVLVLAVLALWCVSLAIERRLPRLPRTLALPALALLAIFLASAAAAPDWRVAALKFSARQAQAALLACCLADQIAIWGWPLARRLGLALIAGAAISAALGLLEITESPQILALLAIFKDQPTMAGGLLRLSSTFAYANIAAMYYEAALPICLAAVGLASRRRARWLLAGAALLLAGATLLTYSRAALLTALAVIAMIMLGALWLQRRTYDAAFGQADGLEGLRPSKKAFFARCERLCRPHRAKKMSLGGSCTAPEPPAYKSCQHLKSVDYRTPPDAVAQAARHAARLCAALLVLGAGVLLLSPTFRVRITAPDVADWYRADYSVTRLPGLAPNELIATPVTIRNRGLVTWRSAGLRPVALSYHWLDPRTRRVVRYNGRRTLLPQPVDPGGALLLSADVQAPDKPGDYLLAWDMVVEHSGWFSERGTPMAEVAVAVAGRAVASQPAPGAEPANMPREIVVRPPPPPRSQLWGAAVRMWSARPLLGIGPDVFRHAYGPELGLRIWDDRLHTNSLYLELLVGAGVAGLAAFLLLVGLALWRAASVLVSAGRKAALRMMDDGRTTLRHRSGQANDERPFDPAVPERVEGQGGRTTNEPNIGRFQYADGFHHQGTKAQRTEKLGVLVSWWLGTLSLHMPLCTGAATRHGRLADDDLPAWMALGCGVALLAFLFHGVLDMFLEYSATSVLLWALIGALGSLTAIGSVSDDRPEHI